MIGEFVATYPRVASILFGIAVSLFITIINYFFMDKERMRELKAKQKELNRKIKEEKDHSKKMEMTNEMMQHTLESMRHSFKPLIITMIPTLLILYFLKGLFVDTSLGGKWIWYYIGGAIASSLVFRKLFKLP